MEQTRVERHAYRVPAHALFGACLATLGLMRARIEEQDAVRGLITATVDRELSRVRDEILLQVTPNGTAASRLVATWRSPKGSADRRSLQVLLETIATFLPAGSTSEG